VAALRFALLLWLVVASVPARADPVARWRPYVEEASARFRVPVDWIERVMRAESGGRTMLGGRPIVSSAGALGLMQLMPGTWADMRARLDLGSDPHAPRDNILAGTLYLRLMHDRFGYPGLFAAYNAGPARYAAVLTGRARLPPETRHYLAQLVDRLASASTGSAPASVAGGPSTDAGRSKYVHPLQPLLGESELRPLASTIFLIAPR
jgi:soluble lytic murein transglycosylase-like protein